jgi:hypothetical protein
MVETEEGVREKARGFELKIGLSSSLVSFAVIDEGSRRKGNRRVGDDLRVLARGPLRPFC